MRQRIIETIDVKVNSTQEEMNQVISGNSIIPIAKISERFNNAIKHYQDRGYDVVSDNIDGLTFQVKKEYEIEIED